MISSHNLHYFATGLLLGVAIPFWKLL